MSFYIPKRSIGGCLTCKQRKKKCDETKPICQRCMKGDFPCLGYGQLDTFNDSTNNEISNMATPVHLVSQAPLGDPYTTIMDSLTPYASPEHTGLAGETPQHVHVIAPQPTTPSYTIIPRSPQILDPPVLNQAISLILSQYARLTRHIIFKPPSLHLEDGIRRSVNDSGIIRWSMYLGAKIIEDLSNGSTGQRYMSWITRFHQQIVECSSSTELASVDLDARLSTFLHLATWAHVLSGTSTGYSLFRCYAPMFLRLAALFPELWSDNSTISISKALQVQPRQYIIKIFVFHDIVTALALGTPPLIHYDTTSLWAEEGQRRHLEWIYGFPVGIVVLLAKILAWRTSRLLGLVPSCNEWYEIEGRLQSWSPTVDRTDDTSAADDIARLAVQESWRQATLIYLYMGMCEVNSADPRVESGVRQVVQLTSAVGTGSPLEVHLFIPCLIAGAAARQEKHRAILRNKMGMFRNLTSLILRGADFVTVLDHLWHGVASGGRPITWEDYVQSRCAALPITP